MDDQPGFLCRVFGICGYRGLIDPLPRTASARRVTRRPRRRAWVRA